MAKKDNLTHCSEQIEAACLAINTHFEIVNARFRNKEKMAFNFTFRGRNERMLEIRFENATLNCLFNHDNVCAGVFLFLDDPNDIFQYIEYCKQTCRYDYFLHVWVTKGCYIEMHSINDLCNILIFPIKKAE